MGGLCNNELKRQHLSPSDVEWTEVALTSSLYQEEGREKTVQISFKVFIVVLTCMNMEEVGETSK